MDREIKKIIDKALKDEYNKGYMQGIWDYLRQLMETHKLPTEIYNDLLSQNIDGQVNNYIQA